MAGVTAKFKVARQTRHGLGDRDRADAGTIAQGRNAEWAEATPAGMIWMTVRNEVAAEQCTPGRPFRVLFTAEDD